MDRVKKTAPIIIVVFTMILSFLMHLNIFDKGVTGYHTWRQSQTGWNIRNFYRYDSNIFNPRIASFNNGHDNILRYEFPMLQWGVAMAEKVFGETNRVMRVSIFLLGLFSLVGFYFLLRALGFSPLLSSLGVFAFNFSPVFYYYTVNPLPDNLALSAGIWYLYFFVESVKKERLGYSILAGFFISIAALAKLPFIILGGASFAYVLRLLLSKKHRNISLATQQTIIYFLFLIPVFLWYKWVIPGWSGNGILKGVFDNQISYGESQRILRSHAEHMFPYVLLNQGHWLFLLTFVFFYFKNKLFRKEIGIYLTVSLLFVILYFLLEINMINVNHDYYMLPFLPFLFMAVAYGIRYWWNYHKITRYLTLILLISIPFFCYDLSKDKWTAKMGGYPPDLEIYQEELTNAVPRDEKCIIVNDPSNYVFAYMIDKQGYIFANDHLPAGWITDLATNHHIKYMYSNSRKIDERADVKERIDSLILEAGSIRVFKLKEPVEK